MPLHHVLAGRYNRRVTIQRPVVGSDSEGSPTTIWSLLALVWAKVETLTARERVTAAQAQLDVTHSVTIRYRRDVTHNMRVLFGGRVLEIVEVILDERRHVDLELVCREIVI